MKMEICILPKNEEPKQNKNKNNYNETNKNYLTMAINAVF